MADDDQQVDATIVTAALLLILAGSAQASATTDSLGKYDPCIAAGRLSRVSSPPTHPHRRAHARACWSLQQFRQATSSVSLVASRGMDFMWEWLSGQVAP